MSAPPTISWVGDRTAASLLPARSGRPPRETTATMRSGWRAAATRAAAAPVLAPKETDWQLARLLVRAKEINGRFQPVGEETDVEHIGAISGLLRGQQVEQQGRQAPAVQRVGDGAVACTESAGAAAMREHNDRLRRVGNAQHALQTHGRDDDRVFV